MEFGAAIERAADYRHRLQEIVTRVEAPGDHAEMGRIVPEFDQPFLRELIHPPLQRECVRQ